MQLISKTTSFKLAELAYEVDYITFVVKAKRLLTGAIKTRSMYVQRTDTEAFFIERIQNGEKELFCLFPGTASATDVEQDLMCWKKEYIFGGRIHAGFLEIQKECENDFLKTMFSYQNAKVVYFIGHSLGAQVALLLADTFFCFNAVVPEIKQILLGCPRGWNQEAVQQYYNRHHRYNILQYENKFDIVTKTPSLFSNKPGVVINAGGYGHRIKRYLKTIGDVK